MKINFTLDRETLMALPMRLRVTCAVVLGGLMINGLAFLADDLLDDRVSQVAQLRSQLAQLRQQSQTLKREIDDYPAKRPLYDQAMASGLLTNMDRPALIRAAQDLAASDHLPNLSYRLEPQLNKTNPMGKYRVGSTLVTIESGALLDQDALNFWDQIVGELPARFQIVEASLERTGDVSPAILASIQAGKPVSLLSVKLAFHWISLHPINQEAP